RLRLTELRTSSIDISTITALRRAIVPYTPMQNNAADRIRKLNAYIARSVLPGQDDRADRGGEQDEREGEERNQVRAEIAVADRDRGVRDRACVGLHDHGVFDGVEHGVG